MQPNEEQVPERMALNTYPEWSKGFYKDNPSRIVGVEVEITKAKGYEGKQGSGD